MPRSKIQVLLAQQHIPASALASHLGGAQVVWRLDAARKLGPVAVKVGVTDYSFTELVGGQIKEGDALVTGEESSPGGGQGGGQTQGAPRFGGPRR
jgi:hypothetical protein